MDEKAGTSVLLKGMRDIGRGGVVEKSMAFCLIDCIFSAFQQPSSFIQLPYLMIPVVPVYHHASTPSLPESAGWQARTSVAKAGRLSGGIYDIERACQ
jgi:hypothetical protein